MLSLTFPTLLNLADHKDAMVEDVWDDTKEDEGWLPIFLRSFNDWELEIFLHALHRQKISPSNVDKLLLKGSRVEGFFVKRMYYRLVTWYMLPFLFDLEPSCVRQPIRLTYQRCKSSGGTVKCAKV